MEDETDNSGGNQSASGQARTSKVAGDISSPLNPCSPPFTPARNSASSTQAASPHSSGAFVWCHDPDRPDHLPLSVVNATGQQRAPMFAAQNIEAQNAREGIRDAGREDEIRRKNDPVSSGVAYDQARDNWRYAPKYPQAQYPPAQHRYQFPPVHGMPHMAHHPSPNAGWHVPNSYYGSNSHANWGPGHQDARIMNNHVSQHYRRPQNPSYRSGGPGGYVPTPYPHEWGGWDGSKSTNSNGNWGFGGYGSR
ncbi:unnamed protein product [Periconia digitata]|uniref:Uncharacterized protein n=1 Tax=Periconia digitata TaxID=1303443 RepID=A0A9W4XL25_9PLEO|nr:unnamed protein product [Periconia digitata]